MRDTVALTKSNHGAFGQCSSRVRDVSRFNLRFMSNEPRFGRYSDGKLRNSALAISCRSGQRVHECSDVRTRRLVTSVITNDHPQSSVVNGASRLVK